MLKEQIKMPDFQEQQISNMLQKQGLTESEINGIISGEYLSFQNDVDLTQTFSSDGNYQNILRGLADGYSIDELQQKGINPKEINDFMQELEKCNLTIDNAKAINQYSNDSNMILSIKRGLADRGQIQNKVASDMISKLQTRGLSQEQILNLKDYIGRLNFNKPLYENYEMVNKYMQEVNIPRNCYTSICMAVKSMDSLEHIDGTLASLDDGLSKSRLPQSMKLYRAIKTNGKINTEDYIGKSMNNKGYTSTSLLYNSSFAKFDDYDTVMEIYAPKGTQGLYMTLLSDYDNTEQEILLNPNNIYVMDVQKGVVDPNGKTKTILKGLLLSKERECYKCLDENQKFDVERYSQKLYDSVIETTNNENNLPEKQNRLSTFFNKMRFGFLKKNLNKKQEELQYDKKMENVERKIHEKKSWELEPNEKIRIQKETDELAKRFRKQDNRQKHSPMQEMHKERMDE